ncbi:MAG: hypothetical protein KDD70_07150 [Bdellovibrionales bacterium]|nr:hypothetical protein [Bdellovibrionales bacterium]
MKYFLLGLLILLHVGASAVLAEGASQELPFVVGEFREPFPKEEVEKILDYSFFRGASYNYKRQIVRETGDLELAKLAWKRGEAKNNTRVLEVLLEFESVQAKSSKPTRYLITVEYDFYRMVLKHQYPGQKEFANGMMRKYNLDHNSPWGGYMFGNKVPGVLFLNARTLPEMDPAMLLCPRFGLKKEWAFVLKGKNPKTKLISVSARVKGDASSHILTGYKAGSEQIRYTGLRAPESLVKERFVVMEDTKIEFPYEEISSSVPGSITEEGPTPVGLVTNFELVNSAGHKKSISSARVVWVNTVDFKKNKKAVVFLGGSPAAVDLQPGLCVQLTPMEYDLIHYTRSSEEKDLVEVE